MCAYVSAQYAGTRRTTTVVRRAPGRRLGPVQAGRERPQHATLLLLLLRPPARTVGVGRTGPYSCRRAWPLTDLAAAWLPPASESGRMSCLPRGLHKWTGHTCRIHGRSCLAIKIDDSDTVRPFQPPPARKGSPGERIIERSRGGGDYAWGDPMAHSEFGKAEAILATQD
jgi:hypothetical protein